MSRRLSLQLKSAKPIKPKVKFADELVFLDSIKVNDVENVRLMLRRASADIDINRINEYGKIIYPGNIFYSFPGYIIYVFI